MAKTIHDFTPPSAKRLTHYSAVCFSLRNLYAQQHTRYPQCSIEHRATKFNGSAPPTETWQSRKEGASLNPLEQLLEAFPIVHIQRYKSLSPRTVCGPAPFHLQRLAAHTEIKQLTNTSRNNTCTQPNRQRSGYPGITVSLTTDIEIQTESSEGSQIK
jgi:hypothetical protein